MIRDLLLQLQGPAGYILVLVIGVFAGGVIATRGARLGHVDRRLNAEADKGAAILAFERSQEPWRG